MRKVNFLKISLKCGFLYSNILNSNAMEDKNMALLKAGAINNEIKETKEINIKEETTEENTTEESDVYKSLEIIREAEKKIKNNFRKNFENIINKEYYKYRNDSFYQRKRIGSILPIDSKKLIDENKQLYKNLNEIFNGNFFTDFKFNNILDQYIKFNSILDYVNNLPSIKKLWNIYGKNGYTLKLYNFNRTLNNINVDNIDFFSDKYKTEKNSYELNKIHKKYGLTSRRNIYNSIGIHDCFLNNVINSDKKKSLSKRNLIKSFDEKILNEIFYNETTTFHELNHFNNNIIKILTKSKNSAETDSFTAIESDIHKIIRYYCKMYYNENNNKKFLSSKISEILNFINEKLTDKELESILTTYQDKIYNNEIKDVDYSKKLERIKKFLNFGSKEQQCKLLEILSYVGKVLIKRDNNKVEDNISKYSTTKIDEMSAECCSYSLSSEDEYNKYSEILFAFEYSYITKFVEKEKEISNSNNINISNFKILKQNTQKNVEKIENYNKYILDILESIQRSNYSKKDENLNVYFLKKNNNKHKNSDSDSDSESDTESDSKIESENIYKYFTISLTEEEIDILKKSDDKNLKKLIKEYKKKIRYTDFLEDCYVDVIMNKNLGLDTYVFKLGFESSLNSSIFKEAKYEEVKFKINLINQNEIKNNIVKIEKLMEDFYKYLFKKNDKNLEKLNTLDRVQLICIFYRILNDNKKEDGNFYKYECNTLDSIVINNILNNIIIEKNVKYSLKEQQDKEIEKLNMYKYFNFFEVEDIRNANDDMDIDYFVNYKKFKTLGGKKLNIELEKNKNIDDCKVVLYINKNYLEKIKKGIFEESSSNDNIFGIYKNFDNDRDSKKCNYYFDKSNFVKNDLNYLSEVKKEKENIDETYESFNKKYKKIIEIFKDFDGDYLFYKLYNKYCKNYKNSDDSCESKDENNDSYNLAEYSDEDSYDSFNRKRKKNRKKLDNSYKSEYKNYEAEKIIKEAKNKTEINTSYIKDLLDNINKYRQMINEDKKKGLEKNYKELCTIYNEIINLLPFQSEKFKELKNEFLEKYEELNKDLEEINKKINEFNDLFEKSKDNIEYFIEGNINAIYNNIEEEDKSKNNGEFIEFFNKKYGTNYQIKTNKEPKNEESESEFEFDYKSESEGD